MLSTLFSWAVSRFRECLRGPPPSPPTNLHPDRLSVSMKVPLVNKKSGPGLLPTRYFACHRFDGVPILVSNLAYPLTFFSGF